MGYFERGKSDKIKYMIKVVTHSPRETQSLAKSLGAKLTGGEILALFGNLGSGKTTFVQGLVKGLGIRARVSSPTFLVGKPYPVPHSSKIFYHFDLYRLKSLKELAELGFWEILHEPHHIVAIEWAEKIRKRLPKNTLLVKFGLGRHHRERLLKLWLK